MTYCHRLPIIAGAKFHKQVVGVLVCIVIEYGRQNLVRCPAAVSLAI